MKKAAVKSDTQFDSPRSEQGIIGCALLQASCIEQVSLPNDAFSDVRNRELFGTLKRLWSKYKSFDLITVSDYLNKKGLLDNCGGMEYLTACQDCVPSAANLPNYIGIVRDKYKRRKLAATCAKLQLLAQDDLHLDDLLFIAQSDLADVLDADAKASSDGENLTWSDLLEFETSMDPNNVIGVHDGRTTRWLCKGHSAWLIGPSGVGKSSLLLQFGVSFAAGRPLWGITPQRPLRVLVVQAENDKGDMAEMARGIESGLKLEMNEDLQRNIRVRSVSGKIGQAFCAWMRTEIESFKADLVLVDPLLSFAGIDVSRQDQASQFCRVWLDPVLRDTGAVMISAHHTGKPPRRDGKDAPQTLNELAYAGIGSSELVNWARAVMLLQPAGDDHFRLMLAKRGSRAGAVHPSGEPTQVIWLRHATDGTIFWEQTEPVEEEKTTGRSGAPSKVDQVLEAGVGPVIDQLLSPVGLRELARRISNHAATLGHDISQGTARKVIARLVETKAIIKINDEYTKR